MTEMESDSELPFIETPRGSGSNKIHHMFLSRLVEILKEAGYEDLNYDHVTLTITKEDIPLEHEDGKCDLSVGLAPGVFAQIEIEVRRCVQK